uniref:Uncharacterized protein n=1 Tax=viral metagenome TaxID=1070528 RepID=A0A6C0KD55_9ZZZZ
MNQNEIELSCVLKNNKKIHRFAQDVLWLCIKKTLDCGKTKKELLPFLQETYITTTSDTDHPRTDIQQLKKAGLGKKDSIDIINCVVNNDKTRYRTILNTKKFYKIMGAFYSWTDRRLETNQQFIRCCVENDPNLKKILFERIREIFHLPKNISSDKIDEILNKSVNSNTYYSTIIDTPNPQHVIRRNLTRNKSHGITSVNPKKNNDCHKDVTRNRKAEVVLANSYYDINNTFFHNISNLYNRPTMSGPSGSIVIAHDLIFNLLGIENNRKNRILLLCCSIADYVPYHHSVTEILIAYSNYIKVKYTIDKDPVEFVKSLCKHVL